MRTLPARRNGEPRFWDPFREFDDLHSRFASAWGPTFVQASTPEPTGWTPLVDIEETDASFIVEAELPGVNGDDIDVELDGNELTIHGEVKERERTGVLRRSTRRTGEFDYRVVLPSDVDSEQVEAWLEDGVLRLEIPKSQAAKPRKIEITRS
jgi:HSP20 family protein